LWRPTPWSGAPFAVLVFATSVVSIPMILDRDTDAISAAITSIEVFFHNVAVMVLWGGLLTGLLVLGMLLPWHAGLLVVGPGWGTRAGMPTAVPCCGRRPKRPQRPPKTQQARVIGAPEVVKCFQLTKAHIGNTQLRIRKTSERTG